MVQQLVQRARRRYVANQALAQLALAACVAVGAIAALLAAGTTYLAWWTVPTFASAGLALGLWRTRSRVPSDYEMAIRLDQRAGLHDALSTAVHFGGERGETQTFRRLQWEQAQAAANSVNLESAVPFTTPKAIYVMAALALLATGLFAIRYRKIGSLDLRPPLTQVLFEDQENPALAKHNPTQKKGHKAGAVQSLLAKLGVSLDGGTGQQDKQPPDALDRAVEEALRSPGTSDARDKKGENPGAATKDGKSAGEGEQGAKGDPLDGGQDKGSNQDANNGQNDGQDQKSGEEGGKNSSANDNSSLLSKLKDAVSNMMSKAKQDAGSDKQKGGQQQGSDQQAKSEKGGGEKGKSGQGQQQGQQQASTQEADPNGEGQEGQQSQGKSSDKDSSQQASSQPGSGIGHQDGSKDMKAAEQLKALGKLSEIIGRRANTVSGETSVEVESSSQQLRTGYSNNRATHGQTDGDVNRDEVPPALQQYVQQYFQEVRKPIAKSASRAPATPQSPTP